MPIRWHDPHMSPRKWVKTTLAVVVPFVLFTLVGKPLLESYQLAHPRRVARELPESEIGRPVERVTFAASDGTELVGWFIPGSGGGATIVASHGSHANGPITYPGYAFLNDAGYHLFVFDHRAHGQSGGKVTTLGPLEVRDLRGAVAYLRSRADVDPTRIGAIGCSMGAGITVGAAAEDPAIAAVVAEGVYADLGEVWDRFGYVGLHKTPLQWSWGALMRRANQLWTGYPVATYKPVEVVGQISPRPVLIIHGEHDNGATTVDAAHRLYQAAREPKELWIVDGAYHCSAHAQFPELYEERVLQFFDRALD